MRKYFINYGNLEYMTISLDNARKIAIANGKPLEIYSMVECSKDCFLATSKQIEPNEQFEQQPKEPMSSQKSQKEQIELNEQMLLF